MMLVGYIGAAGIQLPGCDSVSEIRAKIAELDTNPDNTLDALEAFVNNHKTSTSHAWEISVVVYTPLGFLFEKGARQ
jgi:hypothetical protein